jgi:hypothetical protein
VREALLAPMAAPALPDVVRSSSAIVPRMGNGIILSRFAHWYQFPEWIAKRLQMGHPGSVSRQVGIVKRDKKLLKKLNELEKMCHCGD